MSCAIGHYRIYRKWSEILVHHSNKYADHLQTMIGVYRTKRTIIYQKWRQLRRAWRCRDYRVARKDCPIKRPEEFHRVATGIDERRNLDSDRRVLITSPGSIPARWPVPERGSKMRRRCLGLWRGKPSRDPFSPGTEIPSTILFTGASKMQTLIATVTVVNLAILMYSREERIYYFSFSLL